MFRPFFVRTLNVQKRGRRKGLFLMENCVLNPWKGQLKCRFRTLDIVSIRLMGHVVCIDRCGCIATLIARPAWK